MDTLTGIPIFCVEVKDKKQKCTLFINFKSTSDVEYPNVDLNEDQLVQEICHPSQNIEKYKIPMKLSQLYWPKEIDGERKYVVDVYINDKFAIRRVLVGDVIRHYVIIVTMLTLEEKYNTDMQVKSCGQFIGHRLELDQAGYKVLETIQCVERSSKLINNKIVMIGDSEDQSATRTDSSDTSHLDLFYRPSSGILTCSIQTDSLPDSIGFNDDRIKVTLANKNLMDVHLPFAIDLNQPVKYKFDDRLCLFRAVFRTVVESG